MGRSGGQCRFARLGASANRELLRRLPLTLFRARRVMPVVGPLRGLRLVYPACQADLASWRPPAAERGEVERG